MSDPNIEVSITGEQTRVSRLVIQRLHNLGNYESIRYEVTVDIAPGENASRILTSLESILNDVQAKHGIDDYSLGRAMDILKKDEALLSDREREQLVGARALVRRAKEAMDRRAKAIAALSTLNYTSEHRDAKDNWDDDGFSGDFDSEE